MMQSFSWKKACLPLTLYALLFPSPALPAAIETRNDVVKRRNSPFQKKLFQNIYQSLVQGLVPDG